MKYIIFVLGLSMAMRSFCAAADEKSNFSENASMEEVRFMARMYFHLYGEFLENDFVSTSLANLQDATVEQVKTSRQEIKN